MGGQGAELFVGVTSWNSGLFLRECLAAVLESTEAVDTRVAVLDNASQDDSQAIAAEMGCEVIVHRCTLPDALNELLRQSRSRYTLLMHSDTILLSRRWWEVCTGKLRGDVALVSPQDIGCGPFTRPWGAGKPESSFMLFDTEKARRVRTTRWIRRFRLPFPRRVLDLYVSNVTHRLPDRLAERGMTWCPMKVHVSKRLGTPIYEPNFVPPCWEDELGYLKYGLGNFYSLDGVITHYHNWFERIIEDVPEDSQRVRIDQGGLPLAYLNVYTRRFLEDWKRGNLELPDPDEPERAPRRLPIRGEIGAE